MAISARKRLVETREELRQPIRTDKLAEQSRVIRNIELPKVNQEIDRGKAYGD